MTFLKFVNPNEIGKIVDQNLFFYLQTNKLNTNARHRHAQPMLGKKGGKFIFDHICTLGYIYIDSHMPCMDHV